MKKNYLLIVFFFLYYHFSISQAPEKYVQVSFHENHIQALVELGIGIDHCHHDDNGQVELIISKSELDILEASGVSYELLIPDMDRYHKAVLKNAPKEKMAQCGLDNYESGTMGGYNTYSEMQTQINKMQVLFPDLVHVFEIGKSYEDRSIFAVKISDNVYTDESDTEGVAYYDALIHAREPMTLETNLYYMWWLLENYNSNEEARYLINNRELFFVPVVNPDGYVYNQTTHPDGGGMWRKNRRIHDGTCTGVDLNRNYDAEWGNDIGSSNDPCSSTYRGSAAFSEPETQTIRDFTDSIQASIAFACHSYSDVFISPYGFDDSTPDHDIYAEFASEFIPRTYAGYGNTFNTINYFAAGAANDYFHDQGTIAYIPEIGHIFWESSNVICDRVQEMLPAMKYIAWVAGNYASFYEFKIIGNENISQGETIEAYVRLKNKGLTMSANNVRVKLSSSHPSIIPLSSTIDYGNIPAREFKDNEDNLFQFFINTELQLGEIIPIDIEIWQDDIVVYEDVYYIYGGDKTLLFKEDGETDLAQWKTSWGSFWTSSIIDAFGGTKAITDSPQGSYQSNQDEYLRTEVGIDLSSADNPWLEFDAKWCFNGADRLYIKASKDDFETWIYLNGNYSSSYDGDPAWLDNQHWVQERIDLSAFALEPDVGLEFSIKSDNARNCDGFYFDNLRVVNYEDELVSTIDLVDFTFDIFPNPVKNELTILNKSNSNDVFHIQLVNSLGRTVWSGQNNFVDSHFTINMGSIPTGVYYVLLTSGKKRLSKRIVKIR